MDKIRWANFCWCKVLFNLCYSSVTQQRRCKSPRLSLLLNVLGQGSVEQTGPKAIIIIIGSLGWKFWQDFFLVSHLLILFAYFNPFCEGCFSCNIERTTDKQSSFFFVVFVELSEVGVFHLKHNNISPNHWSIWAICDICPPQNSGVRNIMFYRWIFHCKAWCKKVFVR